MKKLILCLVVLIGIFLGVGFSEVHAKAPYEVDDACSIAGYDDPLLCSSERSNEEKELYKRVKSVLETVYMWIGIITVIVIVIGGIRYMTSTGEAEKIKGAKNTITFAIIGLVVTLAAFAITEFVIDALNGQEPTKGGTHAEEGGGSGDGGADEDKPVEVKKLQVASSTTIIEEGTMQLKVLILPDYAADHSLKFSSENTRIADVSKTGLVTAKAPGATNINIKASNGVAAKVAVTVKELVRVKSITLNPTSLSIPKGKTGVIKATPLPSNAVDKTITWSSKDKTIATVDNDGKVKAKKVGKTEVVATSKNGVTAKAIITVTDPENGVIKVTDSLIQHLDSHYNQSGNPFSGHELSCTNGYSIAATSCGQSSYMASHYVVTKNDLDYIQTAEYSCSAGALSEEGTDWSRMTKSDYEQKFGVTGKYIDHGFDAHIPELKKGHPVTELICGRGGFRSTTRDGCHFVVALSYRETNGGEIYGWNPTNINQGWVSKSTFTDWITNRNAGVSWAMWKK